MSDQEHFIQFDKPEGSVREADHLARSPLGLTGVEYKAEHEHENFLLLLHHLLSRACKESEPAFPSTQDESRQQHCNQSASTSDSLEVRLGSDLSEENTSISASPAEYNSDTDSLFENIGAWTADGSENTYNHPGIGQNICIEEAGPIVTWGV